MERDFSADLADEFSMECISVAQHENVRSRILCGEKSTGRQQEKEHCDGSDLK
jgi:hypothetical protein